MRRNDSGQFAKSGEDGDGIKSNENCVEHSSRKKAKGRDDLAGFSLREYVAEKTRKQYEERGEVLPLQPNSSVVAANKSPIKNATVTTGVADEDQPLEDNTLEVSLSKALGEVVKEENNVMTDVPDDDSTAKKGLVVQKRQIRPRKLQKTMLVSKLYGITKSIAKTDGVAGLVARDLLRAAPSGHSPSSQGPLVEEGLLSQDQDPSNDMPNLRRTTTFQVVNVVEDLDFGEENNTDIRVRRRRR
ncbi:hypothetical protein ACET3Z_004948 [Daucus carota]